MFRLRLRLGQAMLTQSRLRSDAFQLRSQLLITALRFIGDGLSLIQRRFRFRILAKPPENVCPAALVESKPEPISNRLIQRIGLVVLLKSFRITLLLEQHRADVSR